jgi:hypothetical protein
MKQLWKLLRAMASYTFIDSTWLLGKSSQVSNILIWFINPIGTHNGFYLKQIQHDANQNLIIHTSKVIIFLSISFKLKKLCNFFQN